MADIISTLDDLIQPPQPGSTRFRLSYSIKNLESIDTADDVVVAQIQYDVIERAYFQRSLLPPLQPTVNGKVKFPCRSCNDLILVPSIHRRPRALRTEALYGVMPRLDKMSAGAEAHASWFPRRHKPASWEAKTTLFN